MAYADITFNDKNPIKRWLQQRRLVAALAIQIKDSNPQCILDFGAGNGELCKLIALRFPKAKIICYEPTPSLMAEAKVNLADLSQVDFCTDIAQISDDSIELVFCLEVFEHLPKKETNDVLKNFDRLLRVGGNAIIGVPIEIGIPAIYKGIFRMSRRFGAFDGSIKNVLLATLCLPPKERPVSEITPGFSFHFEHLGFDYRNLRGVLGERFLLKKTITSPFNILGLCLNPEVNFLIQKENKQTGWKA